MGGTKSLRKIFKQNRAQRQTQIVKNRIWKKKNQRERERERDRQTDRQTDREGKWWENERNKESAHTTPAVKSPEQREHIKPRPGVEGGSR